MNHSGLVTVKRHLGGGSLHLHQVKGLSLWVVPEPGETQPTPSTTVFGALRPGSPLDRHQQMGERQPRPYSRGQGADVLVATERQADCGKGSALVEHFCYLGGQVAGGSHEYLPEVPGPGGGLLLRSRGGTVISCVMGDPSPERPGPTHRSKYQP